MTLVFIKSLCLSSQTATYPIQLDRWIIQPRSGATSSFKFPTNKSPGIAYIYISLGTPIDASSSIHILTIIPYWAATLEPFHKNRQRASLCPWLNLESRIPASKIVNGKTLELIEEKPFSTWCSATLIDSTFHQLQTSFNNFITCCCFFHTPLAWDGTRRWWTTDGRSLVLSLSLSRDAHGKDSREVSEIIRK